MGSGLIIGILAECLICGLICSAVASSRGMEGGFWWGFFLNVIGIIIVAVRPNDQVKNPAPVPAGSSVASDPNADYRFQCQRCGHLSTGWYQKCPHCGAEGKMVKRTTEAMTASETATAEPISRAQPTNEMAEEKPAEPELRLIQGSSAEKTFSAVEVIGYLKEYRELLDTGALTSKEFGKKKDQLLQKLEIDITAMCEADVIKALKGFKELLDLQVLSREEFEDKKRRLLGEEEEISFEGDIPQGEAQKPLPEQRIQAEESFSFEGMIPTGGIQELPAEEQREEDDRLKRFEELRREMEETRRQLGELCRKEEEQKAEGE